MSYRDDVDALYNRATTLQQEVDQMREQLADRDRQIADAKGGGFQRIETSPGIRALRELPPAEELFSRLINSDRTPSEDPGPRPSRPALDAPTPAPIYIRADLIDHVRGLVGVLTDERLRQIAAVIDAIAKPDPSAMVLSKLRELSAVARRA